MGVRLASGVGATVGDIEMDGARVGLDVVGAGVGFLDICGATVVGDGLVGMVGIGANVAADEAFSFDLALVKATDRPTTAKMSMSIQKKAPMVHKDKSAWPVR